MAATHKFRRGLVAYTIHRGGPKEAWDAGWNATNWLFSIRAWDGIDCFAAVMAQERAELSFKWRHGIFFYSEADMELFGHAIDVLVASDPRWYGRSIAEREGLEVRSLETYEPFYRNPPDEPVARVQFDLANRAELLKRMQAKYPAALDWIDHPPNRKFIDAMFAYRMPDA